jgi:non-specific serine/threonine protein kinase/serine/threonine-protein kinase
MSKETSGPTRSLDTGAETRNTPDPAASEIGRSIGPYRLLKKIGQGGMGEVYEAQQSSPISRRVALKLIKQGMDTRQVVARFESERQALALMNHRSIAQVLDAGATEEGRPFFVMELVRGVPIDRYCDDARLATEDRLRLFLQVCDGVQHAHQKGIIHRDLKPSNVLVAVDGDDARAKIIDFGVAKATAQPLTENTMFTQLGQMIGTPEYMSPEQAEMSTADIDTRSDIYSLGVILYQLLCGSLPFALSELRAAGVAEIQRRLREDEPPRPSTRLSTLGEQTTQVAHRRRVDSNTLVRRLRGDLDWITMKALEKERSRRYSSARDFGRDIERHLSDEPVEAGPPSAAYRASKFVRRHRTGVVASILVAAALLVGTTVSIWQAVRATQAERRLSVEAATAQQVSEFLADLFDASTPGEVRSQELTAREVLDRGAERIDTELRGQPLVQARLQHVMGDIYSRLGIYERAVPLLERSVATQEALAAHSDGLGPVELARSLDALASTHHDQGRSEEGLRVSDRVLELLAGADAEEVELAGALLTRGNLLLTLGRYEEAEAIYLRAVEIFERVTPGGPEAPSCFNNIANALFLRGDLRGAEKYYEKSIEAEERRSQGDTYYLATFVHNLSLVMSGRGRFEEALELERRALSIREQVLGPRHWHTALSLSHMGDLQMELGRPDEAERLLRRALEIDREQFEPVKTETADDLEKLALVLLEQGRLDEAESLLEESLAIRRQLPGASYVVYSVASMGLLAERRGLFEEAARQYRQAIDDADGDPLILVSCHAGLARMAVAQGDAAQAAAELELALAAAPDDWIPEHPELVELEALRSRIAEGVVR